MAATYALLLLPALSRAHFDPSIFIVAGDHFVDAHAAILVRPHSFGYDGQFYYAMALDPWAPADRAGGVTFDHPAWRWQRIFYPLAGYFLSLGNARLLPAAMLGVNLLCLAGLGALSHTAARRWGAGGLPAWAFMLWPGFMTCLTHDTTELLACVCLLAAMLAWLNDRLVIFTVLAMCAALTRETSSLMLGGLALASLATGKGGAFASRAKPFLAASAALVPVIAWHFWLAHLWHGVAETSPLQANIGLPLIGVAQRIATSLRDTVALHGKARLMAAFGAATALGIVAYSVWVAARLPVLMRRGGRQAALCLGWLCMMALICVLSARGPWVDPTAIFRAYSECLVTGWLILVLSGARRQMTAGLAMLVLAVMNWQVCLVQLR